MPDPKDNPLQHPEVMLGSAWGIVSGYLLSVLLTALSLGLVLSHAFGDTALIAVMSAIALMIVMIQFYLFVGLNLSPAQRWKTISLGFTVPLIVLMIVLTIWMFYTLALRTMVS